MARVFDVPRYSNQSKWKILSLLDICGCDCSEIKSKLDGSEGEDVMCDPKKVSRLYKCGALGIILENLISSDRGVIDPPGEAYCKYVYQQGVFSGDIGRYIINRRYGKVLSDILSMHARGTIYTDDKAAFMLTGMVLSGDLVPTLPDNKIELIRKSTGVTIDAVLVSMVSCRLGANAVQRIQKNYTPFNPKSSGWESVLAWYYCMRSLKKSGPSLEAKNANDIIRGASRGSIPDCTVFQMKNTYASHYLGTSKIFKFLGFTILIFDDRTLVLDGSQIDQLVEVSKSWDGFYSYVHNWRLCGDDEADGVRHNVINALASCRKWMAYTLRRKNYTVRLANSMKKSQAYLENVMHDEQEPFNMGSDQRSQMILKSIRDVIVLGTYFHDLLISLPIGWRTKIDLSNMHHGLPCPDGDVFGLIKRLDTVLGNPNKVYWPEFKKLADYKSSHDLSKVLINHRLRNKVKIKSLIGNEYKKQTWYKLCIKGVFSMPDEEDWGKVFIDHSFPFSNTIKHWYMDAGDVSHVSCNPNYHGDFISEREMDRLDKNELLYAMRHAPDIEPGISTDGLLKGIAKGNLNFEKYDSTSVKMESNKYPPDSRDIHAADGITRVLTSFYDRQAITISNQYSGIVARKTAQQVDKVFDTIAAKVSQSRSSNHHVMCISTDIKGWSPTGDRHGWSYMSDRLFRMSKCKIPVTLEKLWDGMKVVVDKMGQYQSFELKDCLFQGWTPLCDSNLNLACNLKSVNNAKKAGLLTQEEGAWTATLIDDAIQCIEFKKERTKEELESLCKNYLEIFKRSYSIAAAELSLDKTIFSCIKFIFLNRFSCEGADVVQASKTYSKIDEPTTLRYQTILGKKNSIMGAGSSAVMKGADPLVTYVTSFRKVVEILMDSARDIEWNDSARYINFLFMPVSMGGMEMPNITNWLTSESPDKIVSWLGIMETYGYLSKETKAHAEQVVTGAMNREFDRPDAYTLMSSPRSVYIKGIRNPETVMTNAINTAMGDKIESKVFAAAWNANTSRKMKGLMREFLSTGTWDCSILEMMSACLPNAWRAGLISRIQKNEIVTMLLPFKKRVQLNRHIKDADREWIVKGMTMPISRPEARLSINRSTIMHIASEFREDYYRHNDVVFVNHTLPDWGVCLARTDNKQTYCFKVWCDNPRASCVEESNGHTTRNLYDGIPPGGMRRPKKTSGFMKKMDDTVRNLTVIQKYMAKTVMLCDYIYAKKGDARMVFSFILSCWGAREGEGNMSASSKISEGTSTKRLTGKLQVRSHQINCFPNTQGIVHVEGENWQRFADRVPLHSDFLAIVTTAKVVAILELACGSKLDKDNALYYNVVPGSVVITQPHTYKCGDFGMAADVIRDITESPQEQLRAMFMESWTREGEDNDIADLMDDAEIAELEEQGYPDEEEENYLQKFGINEYPFKYTQMDFRVDPDPEVQMEKDKEESKQYLRTIVTVPETIKNQVRFSFNLADIPRSKSRVKKSLIVSDEARDYHQVRVETQIRQIKTKMNANEAGLGLLLARIHENTPFRLSERLMKDSRKNITADLDVLIPKWHDHWKSACGTVKTSGLKIYRDSVDSCFVKLNYRTKSAMTKLETIKNDHVRKAYVECLLSVRGRPNCSEMYRILAAVDKKYLKECWYNASLREMSRGNHSISLWYKIISEHVSSCRDKRDLLHKAIRSYGYDDDKEVAYIVGGLLKADKLDNAIDEISGTMQFSYEDQNKFKETIGDIMVLNDSDLRQDFPWIIEDDRFPLPDIQVDESFGGLNLMETCEVKDIAGERTDFTKVHRINIGGKSYPTPEGLWLIEMTQKRGTESVIRFIRGNNDTSGKECSEEFLNDEDLDRIVEEHINLLEQGLRVSDEA